MQLESIDAFYRFDFLLPILHAVINYLLNKLLFGCIFYINSGRGSDFTGISSQLLVGHFLVEFGVVFLFDELRSIEVSIVSSEWSDPGWFVCVETSYDLLLVGLG